MVHEIQVPIQGLSTHYDSHHSSSPSFWLMIVPSEGVSEAASIVAVVETSMAASVPSLFARSPADPTLDGNDKMSAVETSVLSDVEQLERPEGTEAIMV